MSDRAELDRVIELYMAGEYEQCSSDLESFLSPREKGRFKDTEVIERGRLYYATCSILLGKHEQARESLLTALKENPLMQSPDSLTFPPPVVSLFLEVRDEVQQLIAEREREQVAQLRQENERARRKAEERRRREQALEQLAQEELVVKKNSRFVAAIPFGIGQFQNGKVALGAAFLAGESGLAVTALTSGIILHVLVNSSRKEACSTLSCVNDYNRQAQTAHTTLTWSTWGFLGLAVLGIAEAQWSFKPERKLEVRRRPLPKELQIPDEESGSASNPHPMIHSGFRFRDVAPLISASHQGGFLGIRGRF